MAMPLSIPQLADRIRTEGEAYEYLEQLRWGDQPVCPHCGSVRQPYFLKPRNGGRKTTRGKVSERRLWKCSEKGCRKQFSVLTGTIMHGSHIPVRTWIFVIFEMVSSKNGVAAREIERKYGLTPKSAWFLTHRVREAMKRDPLAGLLSGRVVADESWYGGKPSNRHGHDPRVQDARIKRKSMKGYKENKAIVLTLISRETGEARSRVIPTVNRDNLRAAIAEQVDMPVTHLHTDGWHAYKRFADEFASHSSVDHGAREYVRGDVSTNQAENYFSQLQRSLDGTHHHVSHEHLDRYLAEFDFRYSTCKESDSDRMARLVGRVHGRRLSYRD